MDLTEVEHLEQENQRLRESFEIVCQLNELLLKYRNNLIDFVASCDCGLKKKQARLIGQLEKRYNQMLGSISGDKPGESSNHVQDDKDNDNEQSDLINLCESGDEGGESFNPSESDNETMTTITTEPQDEEEERRESLTSSRRRRQTKKVNYFEIENATKVGEEIGKESAEEDEMMEEEDELMEGHDDEWEEIVVKKTSSRSDGAKRKRNIAKKFKCDWPGCKYRGKDRNDVRRHRPKHERQELLQSGVSTTDQNDEKFKYKCYYEGCDRAFTSKNFLRAHMLRVHKLEPSPNEKPFKCDWPGCDYRSKSKCGLIRHMMTHTQTDKKFKCPQEGCGKAFAFKEILRNHMLRHEERRYKCAWPGCDAAFFQPGNLRDHLLVHDGQKKFGCDWPGCEYKGLTSRGLKRHQEFVHLKVRNYPCTWPGCEKKFFYRNKLATHMCIHLNEKPIQCKFEGCNKRFVQKGNMLLHFRTMHERHAASLPTATSSK